MPKHFCIQPHQDAATATDIEPVALIKHKCSLYDTNTYKCVVHAWPHEIMGEGAQEGSAREVKKQAWSVFS